MSELPQGWTTATLKDLVGPQGLFTDGDWILSEHLRTGNDVRLIQLADIGVGRFLHKSQKFISQNTADELGVTYLRDHDVLISRMAHPLARACLFPHSEGPCITAVDVAIARCDQKVSSPEFIMNLCNTHHVLSQAEAVSVGTTRKRISRKNLEKICVPLPPLNEQHRIVAKLEKLLSRVDAAQARLANIPRILKRFRQSVLAAACSGRLTADWRQDHPQSDTKLSETENLPSSWRECPLSKVVRVTSGEAFKKSEYASTGARLLQIANVSFGEIIWEQRNYLPAAYLNTHSDLVLEEGDILIALNRPLLNWRLKVARVRKNDLPAILYQRVGKFGFIESEYNVETEYLFFFLQSFDFILELAERLSGTDQPYINPPEMLKITIPVPPLAEQKEIVRRVEALFKTADALEARYRTAKAHVDKITQSILAKAFRGELVSQDPDDEPPSFLLERIKQLHNSGSSPKGKRKGVAALL